MEDKNGIIITMHDKLLRAWENSMEMTRDFETHSKDINDDNIKQVFKQFSEDEGRHASKLRELILEQQSHRDSQ
jgi:rubrerythrin